MADRFYDSPLADNPIVQEGLRRRARQDADIHTPVQVDTIDPYKGQWGAETVRSQAARVAGYVPAASGLARKLAGDDVGAMEQFQRFGEREAQARELGPAIQTFDDAAQAGGGAGDYGAALAYQGAQFVPDLVASLTGAGIGAAAGRHVARGVARRSIQRDLNEFARSRGVTEAAERAGSRTAALAGEGAAGAGNGLRVGAAAGREAVEAQTRRQADRLVDLIPGEAAAVRQAATAGRVTGAAAGQFPGLNTGNVEMLAREDTDQEDAAKILAGTTVASYLGAMPIERFLGRFGEGAQTVARESAERFLPRVAKEAAKQGLAEGSTEVAQQATQLAGHKWVDDNIDLMSPEAMQSYLASFAAGALVGGALGGSGEFARASVDAARPAAAAARERAGELRTRIREELGAFADKREAGRVRPGDPIPADGVVSGGGDLQEILRRARGAVDGAATVAKGAAAKFKDRFDGLQRDDDLDTQADELAQRIEQLHSSFEATGQTLGPEAPRYTNPVQMESRLQDLLMRNLNRDSPVWGAPEAARSVGTALENVALGRDLSARDNAILDALVGSSNSGIDRTTLNLIRVSGKELSKVADKVSKLSTEDGEATNTQMADAMRAAQAAQAEQQQAGETVDATGDVTELETDTFNGGVTERTAGESQHPMDALLSLRADRTAARERLTAAREGFRLSPRGERVPLDPAAAAQLATELEAEQSASNQTYMGELAAQRERILSNPSTAWTRNSKGGGPAAYEAKKADPSTVEAAEPRQVGRTLKQPQLIDLSTLMVQNMARLRDSGVVDPEGNVAPRDALMTALGDLQALGIAIKPETFSPGELRTRAGDYLATLYDSETQAPPRDEFGKLVAGAVDIQDLKGAAWTGTPAGAAKKQANRAAREAAVSTRTPAAPGGAPGKARPFEMQVGEGMPDKDQGDVLGDGVDEDAGKRAPRERPQATEVPGKAGRKSEFVSSETGVADVNFRAPYAKLIESARKADTTQARYEAGLKIGRAELDKQRDAGMSTVRYNRALSALNDPKNRAIAARYWNSAVAGKYDGASVRFQKADQARVDRKEAAREAKQFPVDEAASGGTRTAAPANTGTARYNENTGPAMRGKKPQSFQDDLEHSGDAPAGKHDYAKETALARAILKAMGFHSSIRVEAEARKGRGRAGGYAHDRALVVLGENLTGAERIEVLSHEIGHAVVAHHLADKMGVDVEKLRAPDGATLRGDMWMDLLRTHDPKLHAALEADYHDWLSTVDVRLKNTEIRALRSGLHRGRGILERNHGVSFADLDTDTKNYLLSMNEWLADNIARALTTQKAPQGIIGKFFGEIATALRRAWRLLTGEERGKYKPAKSVDKWVRAMFNANKVAVREATGLSMPPAAAENVIEVAVYDAVGVPADVAMATRAVRDLLRPQERQILTRVLDRPAAVQRLRELYAGDEAALKALDGAKTGMEAKIALAYAKWKAGEFTVGPQGRSAFFDFGDDLARVLNVASDGVLAQRVFADLASGKIARVVAARGKDGYDVRQAEARSRGTLNRMLNATEDVKARIAEPLSKAFDGSLARMWNAGVPALREIASNLRRPGTSTGDDEGMQLAVIHRTAQFTMAIGKAMDPLTDREQHRVLTLLQRQGKFHTAEGKPLTVEAALAAQSPQVREAYLRVRNTLDTAFTYLRKAGVDVGKRADFFPVQIDLRNELARRKLTELLSQPKFEDAIRNLPMFQQRTKDGETKPSELPLEELVADLVEGAGGESGPATTQDNAPNFKALNQRSMQFIYDLGDAGEIKAFTRLQTKNANEAFARYLEPMVKRAEYARRFGDDGADLARMLREAKAQGATEAQLAEARNVVMAALGTYGAEGSPVLNAISPGLAQKFAGKRTRSVVNGLQAYQNARVLPLALISSLIDPMGIAVRTGGDFTTAWDGFKLGVRSLYDKHTKAELHDMLQLLGAADDMATMESLHNQFGGAGTMYARKVNEFVFKANGMASWVRTTRYMALITGHQFLIKHVTTPGDKSTRYLHELGLTRDDVTGVTEDGKRVVLLNPEERAAASKDERARDDRVRRALTMFVDQAILRPTSVQAPLWHADPYMGLFTQYKAFAYAIYDQIGGRIAREFRHANWAVLLPTLAYAPGIILAEMLRGLIQYGVDGNPQRDEWGAGDYLGMAAERAGFTFSPAKAAAVDTIQDVKHNRLPGTSQLGPTVSQAGKTLDSFRGRRDGGKTFEESLPASSLWRRWNDSTSQTSQESEA